MQPEACCFHTSFDCSLARRFSGELGLSWRDALRCIRLLRAVKALAATNAPVTKIAFDVGYHSLSAFNAAFRDLTGKSPTEYRATVQATPRRACADPAKIGAGTHRPATLGAGNSRTTTANASTPNLQLPQACRIVPAIARSDLLTGFTNAGSVWATPSRFGNARGIHRHLKWAMALLSGPVPAHLVQRAGLKAVCVLSDPTTSQFAKNLRATVSFGDLTLGQIVILDQRKPPYGTTGCGRAGR